MFSNAPITYRSRDFYAVGAGWANADWNVRLTAYNVFNSHWDSADLYLETPSLQKNIKPILAQTRMLVLTCR